MPHHPVIARFRTRREAVETLRKRKQWLDKQRCEVFGGGSMRPIEAQHESEATARRIKIIESLGK